MKTKKMALAFLHGIEAALWTCALLCVPFGAASAQSMTNAAGQVEHWLAVSVEGEGTVNGGGNAWYAEGAQVTLYAMPDAGANQFVEWTGDTDGCEKRGPRLIVPMTKPRRICGRFGRIHKTLTVSSGYGAPNPAAGAHSLPVGREVSATCPGTAAIGTDGRTRAVCMGWTGTGSVPASGAGTNAVFTLEEDSSITWNWRTDYWISVEVAAPGSVDFSSGWVPAGGTREVAVDLTADWRPSLAGDAEGVTLRDGVLRIPADRPRAVRIELAFDLAAALDATNLFWMTGNENGWMPQTEFSRDGTDAAVSGEDDGSWLDTNLTGPGTLSFHWAATGAGSAAGADFLTNGVYVCSIMGGAGWEPFKIRLPGGAHTVSWEFWRYERDEGRVFLDGVQWMPDARGGATKSTPVPVPRAWLAGYGLAADGDCEAAAMAAAANGMRVWECYVAGLDPTDTAARFRIAIGAAAGPFLSWAPDLRPRREYTVEGKTNLADAGWAPFSDGPPRTLAEAEASGLRFFRVKVRLPDDAGGAALPAVYSVTLDASGGRGASGGGEYPVGADVTVSAGEKAGHRFDGWAADGVALDDPAANPSAFTMPSNDVSLKASWAVNNYTVTLKSGGAGASGAGKHAYASTVTVAAGTKTGYTFANWKADGVVLPDPSANPATFIMPANAVTLTANWTANRYTVTLNGGGTGASGAGIHACGSTVKVAAGTKTGYTFSNWTADGVVLPDPSANPVTFTMPANAVTLTANWAANRYAVTIAGGGAGASGAGLHAYGSIVTVDAGAKMGHTFAAWTAEGVELTEEQRGANPIVFTMPANAVSLTANWEKEEEPPALALGTTEVALPVSGASGTVAVYCDAEWGCASDAEWLEVEKADGGFSYSCQTNPTIAVRTAAVTVTAGRGARTCTFTQATGVPPWKYMVVDLSGGATATNYPVSYLADVPAGGWTDEYKTEKLVLRRIDPGIFTMGSPADELGRVAEREVQHEVTLTKPFYIGVFELTQKQWELVMGNKPSKYPGDCRPVEMVTYNGIRGGRAGMKWPVSLDVDDDSFMGKIRAKTGQTGFDLPTEAQWEYACRAGTTTALNTGKNLSNTGKSPEMDEAGRYKYNGGHKKQKKADGTGDEWVVDQAHAVAGSYLPNAWGLYDMHGNVCEWCLDWYGDYPSGAVADPVGGASGSDRVIRGGSWGNVGLYCRSAYRGNVTPGNRSSGLGFRPVCSAQAQVIMHVVTVKVNTGGTVSCGAESSYPYSSQVTVDAGARGEECIFAGWTAAGITLADTNANPITFAVPDNDVTLTANWIELSQAHYMVVDLAGGTNAASYPVSYLDGIPAGGWTEAYKTEKLVLRKIHPGTFTMGSPHYNNESRHEVTLTKPFYIGVFEITQKQWELVMGNKPAYYKGDAHPVEQVSYDDIRGIHAGAKWPASSGVDAGSFMGKIRAKTGLDGFDLPTEAQWEYACRAGTTTELNTGKNLASDGECPEMNEAGRYYYNRFDGRGGHSNDHTVVGSYLPNVWGLYDMHGNVWEWCLDWYVEDLETNAVTDPAGAASGSDRVIRGGGWNSEDISCRSAARSYVVPGGRNYVSGFRPVCSEQVQRLYVVTVNADGTGSYGAGSYSYGSQVTVEAGAREGFAFASWTAAGITLANTNANPIAFAMPDNNVTLTANWIELSQVSYSVVDLSGGTRVARYPVSGMYAPPAGGWTDEYKTTKLVMRRIEPGTFMMGSPTNRAEYPRDEAQHEVTLTKPFYIGVFELTQKQWELVMGGNPSYDNDNNKGDCHPVEQVSYNDIRGTVEGVKWPASATVDMNSFMGKIRAKTGMNSFDLPTEAQWEYACRAGTTTELNTGKNLSAKGKSPEMDEAGKYNYNRGTFDTHEVVGSPLPNAWGLYNMHGNVEEWCLDWYGDYPSGAATDPAGPASGWKRVLRGGSYCSDSYDCRSAARGHGYPGGQSSHIGFRLVCSARVQKIMHVVTVNAHGTGSYGAGSRPYGSQVTVDAGAREGFAFAGWTAAGITLANTNANPITFAMPDNNVTLTAKWIEVSQASYRVVDLSGGTNVSRYPVSGMDAPPAGGWTDEYKTTKLVMRRIEPGTFMMGSPTNELGRPDYDWAEMQHQVTLTKPFYIGVFELTQKQWELVMGGNPSYYKGDCRPVVRVSYNDIRGAIEGVKWPASASVDAGSFMGKIREKTGLDGFDLPTEAQWEYACRAGTMTALNTGKNLSYTNNRCPEMDEAGRYWSNGGFLSFCDTVVGSYLPNAWGLYNMHGNVSEWCRDWRSGYPSAAVTNPVGGAPNPVGGASRSTRVIRGGSYNSDACYCRSAARADDIPGTRNNFMGFRPVCSEQVQVITHVVTVNVGGMGSNGAGSYPYGSQVTVDAWARGKFAFAGWTAAGITLADTNANPIAFTMPDHDVTLTANWIETHTVTVNADGTGSYDAGSYPYGSQVTVDAGAREGFAFAGWTAAGITLADTHANPITFAMPDNDVTLTANWIKLSQAHYMVVDLTGGTNAASYPVSFFADVPADGWTEKYKTEKLVMRRIPAGTFTMGSPVNELGRGVRETQHEVTLTKPFYIGVFELTQKQWELVMGSNPSSYKGDARPVEFVSYDNIRGTIEGAIWPDSAAVDASSFMGKIRAKTGMNSFDLPTEAQWEYACRAGTTTELNTGKNLSAKGKSPEMDEAGRYKYNGGHKKQKKADGTGDEWVVDQAHAVVGSYLPNAWGLYDMHGNVYEWCLDCYGDYPSGSVTDPAGPVGSSGSKRVRRGGSWGSDGDSCRSAERLRGTPGKQRTSIGFRPVCSAWQ